MSFRQIAFAALLVVACARCSGSETGPDAPSGPAFPSPPSTQQVPDVPWFPWMFYDIDDHATVFKNFAPQWYGELGVRAGSTVSVTLTALASTTDAVADPTKQIDAALFEGVKRADNSYAWTQIARGFSSAGVVTLTATSSSDDALHVVGVEAADASYDTSSSPSVPFRFHVTCGAGDHAACALGAQPGESCTVSPASCDGPFAWCFAPEGTCGNTGTCIRTDVACDGQPPRVCDCDGHTQENECWAHSSHLQIRHSGACP